MDSSSKAERWLCANCYRQLAPADQFCANCGQAVQRHVPTFFEFVHEFFSHYIALERGVLWPSLAALVFKPGKLAREYYAGRRGRYVPPLRLYLTASIVFFFAIKIVGGGNVEAQIDTSTKPGVSFEASFIEIDALQRPWPMANALRTWLLTRISSAEAKLRAADRAEFAATALRRFVGSLYYAMFVLLPLYAGIARLVYLNRRMTYGQHVVYALYSHAFVFCMLLTLFLVPLPGFAFAALLWLFVYPYVELRRVFGGRWWTTFLRANLIGFLYLTVQLPVMFVFFIYSLLA